MGNGQWCRAVCKAIPTVCRILQPREELLGWLKGRRATHQQFHLPQVALRQLGAQSTLPRRVGEPWSLMLYICLTPKGSSTWPVIRVWGQDRKLAFGEAVAFPEAA